LNVAEEKSVEKRCFLGDISKRKLYTKFLNPNENLSLPLFSYKNRIVEEKK